METTIDRQRPRAFFSEGTIGTPLPPARTPGWDRNTERRLDDGRGLTRMIGWISIGVGAAALAMLCARRLTAHRH